MPHHQMASKEKNAAADSAVLLTLSTIPFIMVIGNSMLIPVLPTAEKALNVNSFQVSLLITLFSIPAAIVIPVAGILADRIGRKQIVFYSLLLYGFGGLLAGFSSIVQGGSYTMVLISRIIQGIGAAGTAPIAMVLLGDLYQGQARSKSLGILEASNAFGKVISPILGSLIALITWYAMFFIFPLLCVPVAIALWKVIEEPSKKEKPQPLREYKQHIRQVFQRRGSWLVITFLSGSLIMFTMFGVLFYLSDFLEESFRIGGVVKGFILAIPLLALCLTAYFTGTHVKEKTHQMNHLIVIGLIITTIATAAIPWWRQCLLADPLLFCHRHRKRIDPPLFKYVDHLRRRHAGARYHHFVIQQRPLFRSGPRPAGFRRFVIPSVSFVSRAGSHIVCHDFPDPEIYRPSSAVAGKRRKNPVVAAEKEAFACLKCYMRIRRA